MLNALFLTVFALLCCASLVGWLHLLRNPGAEPFSGKLSVFSPLGLTDLLIMFLTWVAGQMFGAAVLFAAGIQLSDASDERVLPLFIGVIAFTQLVFTGVGLGFIHLRYRPNSVLGLKLKHWREDVKIGAFAFLLTIPPLLILQWGLTYFVDYSHSSLEALKENPNLFALAMVWFGAVISAPISEEIFFRGTLQRWLQRIGAPQTSLDRVISGGHDPAFQISHSLLDKKNREILGGTAKDQANSSTIQGGSLPGSFSQIQECESDTGRSCSSNAEAPHLSKALFAIVVSSLVFASVHIGQGLAPIPLFYLGLVLGYLFFKTGRLLPCIVLHMGLNVYSMFWFTLGVFTESNTP